MDSQSPKKIVRIDEQPGRVGKTTMLPPKAIESPTLFAKNTASHGRDSVGLEQYDLRKVTIEAPGALND